MKARAGFSQDEVAFLQGAMSSTSVARHERARRLPVLQTAMIYEFIFDTCISEMYEGIYIELRRRVSVRARGLLASLERKRRTPQRDHKIAVLREFIRKASSEDVPTTHEAC